VGRENSAPIKGGISGGKRANRLPDADLLFPPVMVWKSRRFSWVFWGITGEKIFDENALVA
jgi:hypothetical protein